MFKYLFENCICLITIGILILFGNAKAIPAADSINEHICKSATIRNIHDFNQLQNCTLVAGFVRIVDMDFSPKDFANIKPSKVEEISEYLFVYRVNGLDSLERLFPLLSFIRGTELLFDTYALTIIENRDLENIGLVSLLRVLSGSLRIEANPLLCYVHTIDWMEILGLDAKKSLIHINNNKSPNHCPLCFFNDSKSEEGITHTGCWSYEKFQISLDFIRGENCSRSNCLSGCGESFCKNCIDYVSDKGCVSFCQPYKYKLAFKRQCVTNCTKYGLVEHGLNCVDKCPKHYDVVNYGGKISCVLNCTGNFVVHNIEDLEGLADCSILNGSLTIEIHEMENIFSESIIEHLEHAFQNLNEITGYLKIVSSPQIITFHFLKNLHTIRGLQLVENRYALYVLDNVYLQELFLGNVAIFNGCIYFHFNPRLCVTKIKDLQKNFKECKQITVRDVSEYSNGERAVCGEDVHLSNATIVDVNSTAALIEVDVLSSSELLLVFGYAYFYKEAPFKNVTKYDGRHGCGKDGWFTDTVVTKRRRHIIKHLKPATRYAYFVNSLTVMDYPYLVEHVSEIRYFKTLPAKPSAVAKLYTVSRSGVQIDLHWWPPILTNGIIEKYLLHYELINATEPKEVLVPNTPYTEICDCPKHHRESHVPTPHVEELYKKEQLAYKDSVLNFLFQKKTPTNVTKLKRNATDPEYEAIISAHYKMVLQKLEQEAINQQDEEKESYIIEHPKPICEQLDTSNNVVNQKENDCEPLEVFKNVLEVPGFRHSTTISNLDPGRTYRFSIRACVRDLINGCGPEKVLLAATISKQLASLLANINHI